MALFQKIANYRVPSAKSANMALFDKFELLEQVPKVPEVPPSCPKISSELSQVPKVPRRHFFQNHPISRVPSAKSASFSPPRPN